MDDTTIVDTIPDADDTVRRISELERICAESYQVIGVLADDCGRFGTREVDKALDNLSQMRPVHEDVLPFPSLGDIPEGSDSTMSMDPTVMDELRISWRDDEGCQHWLTPREALRILRRFYEEWPGGLGEFEADKRLRQ